MRFWMRWIQPTEDYRPLTCPPNTAILGWWCSGYDSKDNAFICAAVEAEDEDKAWEAVRKDWPEADDSSGAFCESKEDDFKPGDRFPIDGWMIERFERK